MKTVPGRLTTALRRLVLCAVLLALVPVGLGLYVEHRFSANMTRVGEVFAPLVDRPLRPTGRAADAVNIAVLTRDVSLSGRSGWGEAVMLVHLDADRRAAWVVAIPSITGVDMPGGGSRAIGATFSMAQPSAVVGAVERLTDVRVDHLAIVDWSTVGDLVDANAGLDVDVLASTGGAGGDGWTAGPRHLGRTRTIDYALGRAGERVRPLERLGRQQEVLQALVRVALHQEMRKDPAMLFRFLDTASRGVAVDDDWSMWDMTRLAFSLRSFRSAQLQFVTMPVVSVRGPQRSAALEPDEPGAHELWEAVARDDVARWAATHARWLADG